MKSFSGWQAALVLFISLVQFEVMGQAPLETTLRETLSYEGVIAAYASLDRCYPEAKLLEIGATDAGLPLHLFVISPSGQFDPKRLKDQNKLTILVNNGIHPGEPCGIDASLILAEELLQSDLSSLGELVLAIVPLYNIGGALNRGSSSRANQEGPLEYGFRGNAKNLDLNRDFIKADSRNAISFAQMYHDWDPDIFVDTHTSNGADYQYVMTLIASQRDKMHPEMQSAMHDVLVPELYREMEERGSIMVPYVYSLGPSPDSGIRAFMDTPRYATGYSNLFNSYSFVTEAHMLKSYHQRVVATYNFLKAIIKLGLERKEVLQSARQSAIASTKVQREYIYNFKMDTTRYQKLLFKGYEVGYKTSKITGLQRKYYDRNRPFERPVRFYNRYVAQDTVRAPEYYVVPAAWQEVIQKMKASGVEMHRISRPTEVEGEQYYIEDLKTGRRAYEGHYLHTNISLRKVKHKVMLNKGDYVIAMNQSCNRFIVEVLEPNSPDSYMAWNLFDAILQQKEYFSDYVFEESAEEVLRENPELREELAQRAAEDPEFGASHWQQLYFIYKHSKYYEPTHRLYPVVRIPGKVELPIAEAKTVAEALK